jgi:hypothetical protein
MPPLLRAGGSPIGRSRGKRSTFSFESNVKFDTKSISEAFLNPSKELIKRINKEGPSIVREAMKEALEEDEKLSAYAEFVDANLFPGEKRDLGVPKAGSGVALKLNNGQFSIRIQLFSRAAFEAFGRDGFYSFKTNTEGREAFSFIPKNDLYAIRVNENTPAYDPYNQQFKRFPADDNNQYKNKVEADKRENEVVILRGDAGVPPTVTSVPAPSNPWTEKAAQKAIEIARKRLGTKNG